MYDQCKAGLRALVSDARWLEALHELASAGFSLTTVEARLEEHAGWLSLATSPEPHAVLAHLVGFLPDPETSGAHSRAYVRIVRELLAWLHAHRDELPALDPTCALLHQTVRLTPVELRRAARACAIARGFAPEGAAD